VYVNNSQKQASPGAQEQDSLPPDLHETSTNDRIGGIEFSPVGRAFAIGKPAISCAVVALQQ
jgi:hypothetical protein